MLKDLRPAKIYAATGYTDLRKGIDGLAGLVQEQFQLDVFEDTLFLFCGRRNDRIKGLYWDTNGFLLMYKSDMPIRCSSSDRQIRLSEKISLV